MIIVVATSKLDHFLLVNVKQTGIRWINVAEPAPDVGGRARSKRIINMAVVKHKTLSYY